MPVTENPNAYRGGRAASSTPGKNARSFDPDRPPWERQPGETDHQWAAFEQWLRMDKRNASAISVSAQNWSWEWAWGYRGFEYDLYMQRRETEDLVRYRVEMNERHRNVARAFQGKVVQWLQAIDVEKMKPADVARWFEIAVRVERLASGANLPAVPVQAAPEDEEKSLSEIAAEYGLDIDEDELARWLSESVRSPGD